MTKINFTGQLLDFKREDGNMIAYKLLRQKADGSITSLFINKTKELKFNEWLDSEPHRTKGYAFRPGWHCMSGINAPHLSKKGRVWCEVEIKDFEIMNRPINQGGVWYLAKTMKINNYMNVND